MRSSRLGVASDTGRLLFRNVQMIVRAADGIVLRVGGVDHDGKHANVEGGAS